MDDMGADDSFQLAMQPDNDVFGELNEEDDEPPNIHRDLDHFRSEWKYELSQQQTATTLQDQGRENIASPAGSPEGSPEVRAKDLFMRGVSEEQSGNMYEAILYYRKAVQLIPDIEFRIEEFKPSVPRRDRQDSETSLASSTSDFDEEDLDDLIYHFNKLRTRQDDTDICRMTRLQQSTHISALPVEVLIYIFKWVISDKHDFAALEQLALVCRGFYLCSRDDELWRPACLRLWGVHCDLGNDYSDWRSMFLERPHVHFYGCYISKTTYYRQGAPSLDSFYKPWHTVDYYRYLRFYPDGCMVMLTSTDDPQTVVAKLNRHDMSRTQGGLCGHYKVTGDRLTAVLKMTEVDNTTGYRYKRRRQNQQRDSKDKTFHVEFSIKDSGKQKHSKLCWQHYSSHTKIRSTGQETVSIFELTSTSYPPFQFSVVRSYTAEPYQALM